MDNITKAAVSYIALILSKSIFFNLMTKMSENISNIVFMFIGIYFQSIIEMNQYWIKKLYYSNIYNKDGNYTMQFLSSNGEFLEINGKTEFTYNELKGALNSSYKLNEKCVLFLRNVEGMLYIITSAISNAKEIVLHLQKHGEDAPFTIETVEKYWSTYSWFGMKPILCLSSIDFWSDVDSIQAMHTYISQYNQKYWMSDATTVDLPSSEWDQSEPVVFVAHRDVTTVALTDWEIEAMEYCSIYEEFDTNFDIWEADEEFKRKLLNWEILIPEMEKNPEFIN